MLKKVRKHFKSTIKNIQNSPEKSQNPDKKNDDKKIAII
jgi:hypothetical protein